MISENVGLFLLQCLGRVRTGGTEGLPEDGGERRVTEAMHASIIGHIMFTPGRP